MPAKYKIVTANGTVTYTDNHFDAYRAGVGSCCLYESAGGKWKLVDIVRA